MWIPTITKKRVAAAAATLSIGGASLVMSGFGSESATSVRAGKRTGEHHTPVVAAISDGPINGRLRLVESGTGEGRFTIERATSASESLSGNALGRASAVTTKSGTGMGTAIDGANGRAERRHEVRVPRRVVIGLPSYEGGRAPSASAPSVDRGTPPSVEPGWTTTIDLGEPPRADSPSVDPGESGTFHEPTVEVS